MRALVTLAAILRRLEGPLSRELPKSRRADGGRCPSTPCSPWAQMAMRVLSAMFDVRLFAREVPLDRMTKLATSKLHMAQTSQLSPVLDLH